MLMMSGLKGPFCLFQDVLDEKFWALEDQISFQLSIDTTLASNS